MTALGALVGLGALGLVARAAARCFGQGSAVRAILAAALVVYALLVAIGLALSVGHHFTGPKTLALLIAAAAASSALAHRYGGPSADWSSAVSRTRLTIATDPLLTTLAVLVGLSLAYAFALVFTAPAEGDAIVYHLARAAYWLQRDGIGSIPGNTEARIDGSPPGANLIQAFTMMAAGSLRLTGSLQFVSLLVACVGIVGVARRAGIDLKAACFGALLFPTLSVVFMHAPTALNDIVVAALALIALYFLLGDTPAELILGGVAVTCLGLTKVTASVAILGILFTVLVLRGLRPTVARALIAAAGTVPTLVWLRLAPETPGRSAVGGVETSIVGGSHTIIDIFGSFSRLSVQALELPGAHGRDALVYPLAGVVTLAVILGLRARGRSIPLGVAVSVAATALLAPIAAAAWRSHRKFFHLLGDERNELLEITRAIGRADTGFTWYGPVALVLVVASAIILARRPGQHRLALVAASPVLWVMLLCARGVYYPQSGRYLMGGFAISAATWGVAAQWRPLAMWAVPTAAATMLITVVHFEERPLGLRLFEGHAPQSVWTRSYNEGIGFPAESPSEAIDFADRRIPPRARLAIGNGLMATAFFGRHLTRKLFPVETLDAAEQVDAEWALFPIEDEPPCRSGWRRVTGFSPTVVAFERLPGENCVVDR